MHDDVIKRKHVPSYWPFVPGIHRSPVNSPHKGQWRRALMFSLICAWINSWANNRKAGHLRHHRCHYDVTVMGHKFKNQPYVYPHIRTDPISRSCGIHLRTITQEMSKLSIFHMGLKTTNLGLQSYFKRANDLKRQVINHITRRPTCFCCPFHC